jgi:phosphoribosylamine---glycine ligase
MNILIIGNGGREHTLAWKIKQSKLTSQVFIAPGNAGTSQEGINLPIAVNDFDNIAIACVTHKIEMVVIGPEDPLVNGLYDFIKNNEATKHVIVIGPSKHAAQLEGSKSFAKSFMDKYQIPTAAYKEFDKNSFDEGITYLKNHALPIVLKADGLAGGKGVVICDNFIQATAEFEMMIKHSKFGEAGYKVVVEEFLDGIEFSVFVLTDGKNYKILPMAKDYKKVSEGDKGLNTGGMGAISPVPFVNDELVKKVEEKIIKPTIAGLQQENMTYEGFVFVGLILVNNEPYVIEYNCRLGDPETEVVLPRLKNDLVEMFVALHKGTLSEIKINEDEQVAAAIVATSGGYPLTHSIGYAIDGLDQQVDSNIFMAGAVERDGEIVSNGGRVFVVTSLANNLQEAVEKSKNTLTKVDFEDMYYRKDIGFEFL